MHLPFPHLTSFLCSCQGELDASDEAGTIASTSTTFSENRALLSIQCGRSGHSDVHVFPPRPLVRLWVVRTGQSGAHEPGYAKSQ